jgi:hypothetical protein
MLAAFMAGAVLGAEARAQKPDSGAFFVRLGNDTIAVETYVRTPQQLVAQALLRTPQTRRYKLTVTRKEDGTISWYEVVNNPVAGVPNAAPPMRNVVTYVGDSARVETWLNAVPRRGRSTAAAGHMVPLQMPFYSTYETAIMQARKSADDTLTMLAASGPVSYQVKWVGADSVTLAHPEAGTIRARVDQSGHMLGFSGEETTFKVVVTRAKWADLAALEKRFAAADAAGRALGALSPRDSLEFNVGESTAVISYGRPSKRGRIVFGGLVPWGKVWRTGANAATQIIFASSIEIHGVPIPAGKYSLWTLPDRTQWRLIINKQTDQWGTDYNEEHDLARLEVTSESIAVPVETFTIAAHAEDETTTVLTLTWDRTRIVIPIKAVKPE